MVKFAGIVVAACSLLFVSSGCGGGSNGSQPPPPPPPANVLAYLHRSGIPDNYVVYDLKVMQSDGTSTTVLSSQHLVSAMLSPDGQTILYSSLLYTQDGVNYYQIATINPDGSDNTVLTPSGSIGLYPKYTPDGSTIVYEAVQLPSGAVGFIGVMNADGSNATIIPTNEYCFPASNGSMIAADADINEGLVTMNMDGSNQDLIYPTAYFVYPGFSADGSTIVFSTSDGHNQNLYSISSDGSNLLQLTNSAVNWDPIVTGGKIYFVSVPSNIQNPTTDSQQIFSMNMDGSNLTQVTNDTLYDGFQTANGLCVNP